MRCTANFVLVLVVSLPVLSAGCEEPPAPPPAVAAPAALRVPFELYGHPGPWWRDNATQGEFDGDIVGCRAVSRSARDAAPKEARKDAGYRSFLECMMSRGWTRGQPPPASQG